MMCSLREEGDESQGLRGVLPPPELAALLAAEHRPLFALQVLSGVVARAGQHGAQAQEQHGAVARPPGPPPVGVQLAMDANLTALEVGCKLSRAAGQTGAGGPWGMPAPAPLP